MVRPLSLSPALASRREFLQSVAGGTLGLLGCGLPTAESGGGSARLTARPGTPTIASGPGLIPLNLGGSRDGFLQVPPGYDPAQPAPFVLALHGAGIGASGPLSFLGPQAESRGFILLAIDSRGYTWDAIRGRFGPDVAFIDRALGFAFARCAVDPSRLVVEGFSDGASYALSLGLANGDLFPRVVAFSPGFIPNSDSPRQGRPEFFISHGRQDPILPIDGASRRIVPFLELGGYEVTYVEYDGVHSVTSSVLSEALDWLLR